MATKVGRITANLAMVLFVSIPLAMLQGSQGIDPVNQETKDPFCMGLGDGCGEWVL